VGGCLLEIAQKLDWLEIEAHAARLLSRLVGYDTSAPQGNTSDIARFIHETLNREGIFVTLAPSNGPKRNVIAQIDGSGQLEPMLLLSPLDVVTADASRWTEFNPFSGYDDGTFIWGRGSIAAKSLVAAHLMCLILINRNGVPLRRTIRLAAVSDCFNDGDAGIPYLAENHLTQIESELCLAWGYPPWAQLNGKPVYFLHRSERDLLKLLLKAETGGLMDNVDAGRMMLDGINAIALEFSRDFGVDENTLSIYRGLRDIAADTPAGKELDAIFSSPSANADVSANMGNAIPQIFADYLRSLTHSTVSIAHLGAGSPGWTSASHAEATVVIRPLPGDELNLAGIRAVSALEKLGGNAPYIGAATHIPGSVSAPNEELRRILHAACSAVSPGAELVEAVCPYNYGYGVLRELGIDVYGFHPVDLAGSAPLESNSVPGHETFGAFGDNERIPKSSLGRLTRILFEACVRMAS